MKRVRQERGARKLAVTTLSATLACILSSCAKTPPPAGKPVAIAKACDEPEQSRVQLTGFLRYVPGVTAPCSTTGGHRTCVLELHESSQPPAEPDSPLAATQSTTLKVKLALRVGDDPAHMDNLPDNFTGYGVAVHLPSGGSAVLGSFVTVDGVVTVRDAAARCVVAVDWVEAGYGRPGRSP